jgi:hypothetical protein
MTVTKTVNGSLLLTDTYTRIYPELADDTPRSPYWVEGRIFFHEMAAGDEVYIKFQLYDPVGQVLRTYHIEHLTGSQAPVPAYHLGAMLVPWMHIEAYQDVAPVSYKTINYSFYEVS